MANQKLDLELKGLWTSPNNLSGVPAGALEIANNVVINSKSLIESRRGQTQYGTPLSIGSDQVNKLFNFSSSLIANYADKMAYDSGNGVWVDYSGTYLAPSSDFKIRSLEALRNFYFTTTKGVYKLDALTSTPRPAGVARALGGTWALDGSSGFLLDDSSVAYRIVWGYYDANNNLLLGAPSQRIIAINESGGTRDVEIEFLIPDTITTSYFYQIYRSVGTPPATPPSEPSDELQLVIQGNPTDAEILAKKVTVVDSTPYSLMRATLYTSPSQEGIANANYQPPFAYDMDVFKGCAFYANVKQKQSLSIALISVDSPSLGYVDDATADIHTNTTMDGLTSTADLRVGMRVVGTNIPTGTTIAEILSGTSVRLSQAATATATVSVQFQDNVNIAGVDYWAGSAQDVATNTFEVETGSSPGINIDVTATNLVEIINTSALNTTIYAYYLSGVDDLPGQILFEERSLGGSAFTATSTAGSSFSPVLPKKNPVTNISVANPTVVTSTAHGLVTGDRITFYATNSTPVIDGERTVTVINPNTFSVPVNVTVLGTSGYWIKTTDIITSSNEVKQNRVYVSKQSQVEAVPIYRYFDIGSANFPIQRVVALRDGIFFFKLDGIYRISGESFESFTVTLLDNTVVLQVPESAVPFNNQVFCFTTQGICAVTDAGVRIMSVPIEDELLQLSSPQFTNFVPSSFGVAYESARLYLFFTVTEETDEFATQAFCYNSLTDTWTRWIMPRTCGIVNTAVNKLFMAQTDTGQILIERKNFTNSDYADEEFAVVIDAVVSETEIDLVDASDVQVGMTIVQGARNAVVEAIDGDTLTVTPVRNLMTGDATVYTPIENIIQWTPIDIENPGILKQYSEIVLFFKNAAFREIEAGFGGNVSGGTIVVPIANINNKGWGLFPWGTVPWGGALGGPAVLRTYVPAEKQRANWVTLSLRTDEAFTGFSLQGVSLIYNPMSSRIK